jgi:hypothetical protein
MPLRQFRGWLSEEPFPVVRNMCSVRLSHYSIDVEKHQVLRISELDVR